LVTTTIVSRRRAMSSSESEEDERVPYRDRAEWADVAPIPQDESANPGASVARRRRRPLLLLLLRGRFASDRSEPDRSLDRSRRLFYLTLVPIRPRWRGERRSLRTLPVASLRPWSLPRRRRRRSRVRQTLFSSFPPSLTFFALRPPIPRVRAVVRIAYSEEHAEASAYFRAIVACVLYTGPHTTPFAW